jgi:pimeloyl-ACP methyl ester carboxylesterase
MILLSLLLTLTDGFADTISVPGGQLEVLIAEADGPHTRVLVLFPGGSGLLAPENFLVRTHLEFAAKRGSRVIVIGPSSQAGQDGYSDSERLSPDRVSEFRSVLRQLNPERLPVTLVGTSRGTVSAVYLANQLTRDIASVVLTATIAGDGVLFEAGVESLRLPTLMVHHVRDRCRTSRFDDARRLSKELDLGLVPVEGGKNVSNDPCAARTFHGFLGVESTVIEEIERWLESQSGLSFRVK